MSKLKKYVVNGALIVGAINGLINLFKQLNRMKENPALEFNWRELLIATGKGVLVGGAGGAIIGGIADYQNSKVSPLNTDKALTSIAEISRLDKADKRYLDLNRLAEGLIGVLESEFGQMIQSTPRLGSTEIGTALKHNFDIDVAINFKPDSFRTTEEMFFTVLNLLKGQVGNGSITKVRDQKKSIGVFFNQDGVENKIDVVPCKLTAGANGSGYLYVNDTSFLGTPSYTKTNISTLNSLRLSKTQQKIAIILKGWKDKEGLPLSSHLLQNLILDAYAYSSKIPRKFTDKVIMVLKHISENLDVAVIRGVENSNNVITNIPTDSKELIIRACRLVVEEYKYQPNSIMNIVSL